MLNITKICRKFNKLPGHFLCLKAVRGRSDILVVQGAVGYVKIPDDLVPRFLQWLSPETEEMILDGRLEDALKYADSHPNKS